MFQFYVNCDLDWKGHDDSLVTGDIKYFWPQNIFGLSWRNLEDYTHWDAVIFDDYTDDPDKLFLTEDKYFSPQLSPMVRNLCWVYFTPPILTHLVTFLMLHASSYINMRNSTQFPVRSDLCHEQGSVQCWCHLSQCKGWQLVINSALQWSCSNNDCSI